MRILYAVGNYRKDVDLSLEPGCWIDRDFYPAVRELDHDIVRFDWEFPGQATLYSWIEKNIERKNRELVEFARKQSESGRFDIMLTALDSRCLAKSTVEAIKAMGIVTVNYHCDDVNAFELNEEMVNVYDYNWTVQPAAIQSYVRAGAKYIFTPCGANPELYKPYPLKKEFDITFVGRNMGYREGVVQHLIDSGVDLRIWGESWPNGFRGVVRRFAAAGARIRKTSLSSQLGLSMWYLRNYGEAKRRFSPILRFEDMIKMYSRSHVNLSFAGGMGPGMFDFDSALRSIKLRDIEVPMSGGFYLAEYTKDIETLFEPGKEIETWANKEELLAKAKLYAANPDGAGRIAKAGRERCLREYTWKKHFATLFKEMGVA